MSEYDDGFDAGILHQCLQEREEDARREHKQRVAAFGAIRRAVAEARRIDRGVFYETDANVIDHREAEAALIRRAIRAAIGSPKA